jgi:hypothetical protein
MLCEAQSCAEGWPKKGAREKVVSIKNANQNVSQCGTHRVLSFPLMLSNIETPSLSTTRMHNCLLPSSVIRLSLILWPSWLRFDVTLPTVTSSKSFSSKGKLPMGASCGGFELGLAGCAGAGFMGENLHGA